jgi:hypothetical protein
MKKTHLKHKHLEQLLLPRLKVLGWVLIVFGFATFTYALILPPEEDNQIGEAIEAEQEISTSGLELEVPKLKLEIVYLGVSMFWLVGSACIFFAWRKKKQLLE